MIRGLFARLTGDSRRGQVLFGTAVAEARRPHWFTQGAVPDTLEGRFAVLATVTALLIVRLEQGGEAGERASVALTERFVESMDSELRQMGIGDPALGRQVRTLVGALGGRVERWRQAVADGGDWSAIVVRSVYRDAEAPPDAIAHSESELKGLWARIKGSSVDELAQGRLG